MSFKSNPHMVGVSWKLKTYYSFVLIISTFLAANKNDSSQILLSVESARCYQCSSDEDKTIDSCGAYEPFDINNHSTVECMGEEATTPGTFCYKSIQQGPRGFIWDGRWRTVIRRCAQVSERGISYGCDWGYTENGVYYEECYCPEDGCNQSTGIHIINHTMTMIVLINFAIAIFCTNIYRLSSG